jgi:hypothetical protein
VARFVGELTQGLRGAGDNPDPATVARWNERATIFTCCWKGRWRLHSAFGSLTKNCGAASIIPEGTMSGGQAQLAILHNLKRLLTGETAINMNVKEMPVPQEAVAAQAKLLEKVTNAYAEDGSLRISVVNDQAGAKKAAG